MSFEKIAPYLKDELVLIGFAIFLFFSFSRYLVKQGIIPQLSRSLGFRVLQSILLYGFILGLAITGLGFGLKYKELSKQEQRGALTLLRGELAANLRLHGELIKNAEQIVKVATAVAETFRIPGNTVMTTMFPKGNVDMKPDTPSPGQLARAAFQTIQNEKLYENPLLRARFNAASSQFFETTKRTLPTIESLSDKDRKRYSVHREVWATHLPILRKVDLFPVADFQKAYERLDQLRANYDVVVANVINYMKAVNDYFDAEKKMTSDRLSSVLAAERNSFGLLVVYLRDLEAAARDLNEMDRQMQLLSSQ